MTLSLASDAAWLSDPGRAFPVAVDPTVSIPQSGSECEMVQTQPTTSYCLGGTSYAIGDFYLTGNLHTMFRFDNLVSSVPYDSLVQSASFDVYEQGAVNTTGIGINLSTIANKPWDTTATWNSYKTGSAWTAGGGDFTTTPGVVPQPAGTANGWVAFNPVQQVQAWVNGQDLSQATPPTAPHQGFMLTSDGASNAVYVTNWQSSSTSQWPYLSVQYMPRIGTGSSLDVLKTELDDKTILGVNAADGDLSVDTSLFHIQGVGLPLAIDQDYDSRGAVQTSMGTGTQGAGWAVSPSFDQPQLILQPNLIMDLVSASGTNAVFTNPNIFGQYTTSPPGLGATAGLTGSSTAQVTFNQSHETWNFTQIAGSTSVYHLTNITDRNGNTVTYAYNTAGTQLISVTDTEGRTVTINYNVNNLVSTITDSTGRQISYGYVHPSAGVYRLSTATYGGFTTSYGYDTNGNLNQITDPLANITTMIYNASRQVTSVTRVTDPSTMTGATTTYLYTPGSASSPGTGVTRVTDDNGHATLYKYDPWDRVGTVTDALGHAHDSTFNPQSSAMVMTNALTQATNLGYDTSNNLNMITSPKTAPGQMAAVTAYDFHTPISGGGAVAGGAFLASSGTDAQTSCSSFTYDAAGNQTASYAGFAPGTVCDGMTSGTGVTSVQNAYQGDGSTACGGRPGELCSTTSGAGNVTSYAYDSLGQLIQVIQPGGSCSPRTVCTTVTYDALSRPATVTDGKGQTTTYSYDAWDRITQILYNGTTTCSTSAGTCIKFVYDADGNVTSRVDKIGTTTFVYDLLNQLFAEDLPGSLDACPGWLGMLSIHDSVGNLLSYCDAGGFVNYEYDAANRNIGVSYNGGDCTPGSIVQPCTVYSYDNANELTGITYPTSTGVSDTLGYDGAGHQTSEHVRNNSTSTDLEVASSQYTTGTDDMTLQHATQDWLAPLATTYTYDSHNRVTAAAESGTGATNYTYSYDADGNMTQQTVGFVPFTYTYSPSDSLCWAIIGTSSNPCLSAPSGANQYTYDNNGNQTGNTAGESISYNSVNQTTSLTPPGGGSAVAMTYTGTDSTERTSAGSTTFANSIFGVAESTTAGTATYFARNANGRLDHITVGTTVYFPYYNGSGSIGGLFDTAGTSVATYKYDPYGGTTATGTAASVNPFRFKGGYQDTTGLYKFGTRYYTPGTASWTQADANQGTIQNPSTVNKFIYAGGDPINVTDPSGMFSLGNFLGGVGSALVSFGSGVSAIATSPGCITLVGCVPTIIAGGTAIASAGASIAFFENAF
jgi:RHS repeat-associated protein